MGMTTMGVKLDEATRDRIKLAAQHIDRTPHWLIKQAIFNYLEQLEQGAQPVEFPLQAASDNDETLADEPHQPFRISRSRSCRKRWRVPPSPPPGAARKRKRCRCCWSRRVSLPRWRRKPTSSPGRWPTS